MSKRKSTEEKEDDLSGTEIMIMCADTSSDITVYMFDEDVLTEEELKHITAVAGKSYSEGYSKYTENYKRFGDSLGEPEVLSSLVYVGIASGQFEANYDSKKKDTKLRDLMPNPIRLWEELATVVYSCEIGEFTIPAKRIGAKMDMRCFKIHDFNVNHYYH